MIEAIAIWMTSLLFLILWTIIMVLTLLPIIVPVALIIGAVWWVLRKNGE